jgi:hypothetical protein
MRVWIRAVLTAGLLVPQAAFAAEPAGWYHAGSDPKSFEIERDPNEVHSGKSSARLASIVEKPNGFGTMMQSIDPTEYHGKRLRLSAYIKAKEVTGWAGMWMRVDGPKESLAFDNMQSRSIQGTRDWTRYEVVLDVAPEARAVAFGLLLEGVGTVWLDDVQLEIVDQSVPTTNQLLISNRKPVNLDLEN